MDPNKDKFKLVNNEIEESFLLEDDEDTHELVETEEIDTIILVEKQKRKKKKRYIVGSIVMLVLSILFFGFGLLWQAAYDLMAICNALWLAFTIEITIGWILFVYNKNIFSPLIHGAKTFGLMIVGKRPKQDYYNYSKHIEENQIPSFYYNIIFISAAIILIPAVITMIILI